MLPGRAPLADPHAEPNLDILQDVDYCLRRVSFDRFAASNCSVPGIVNTNTVSMTNPFQSRRA